ncbi:MAG TPA: polysaccharide biosynthesis C-terminal domain-containing protein [Chitinophagales bacterium]
MGVVKRQGIKNAISSYFGILIGFVSLIIIQPKYLSTEVIGLSRALFALAALLSALIPLGSASIIIKYFPKFFDREKKHHGFLGFILLYPLIGSAITFLLLLVFKEDIIQKYSVNSALFDDYFFWVFPLSIFLGLNSIFSIYLGSIYKSTIPSYFSDIVVRVLYIGLIFLFHYNLLTLSQFIAAYILIYALQVIVLAIYLVWEDRPTLRFNVQKLKEESVFEMTQFGLIAWTAAFASIGLNTVDAIILGAYGLSNLGIYTIVSFVPTIIQTPLIALERISASKIGFALAENNHEEIKNIYYKSCRYLFVLGGFLTVCINVNIAALFQFIKPEYLTAVPIVPIVSIGYLLNMANGTSTAILLYSGKKWEAGLVMIIAFAITVTLDLLLIPILGMKGAAISIAITAVIYDLIKWVWLWKKMSLQPYNFTFVKNAVLIAGIWLIVASIPNFSSPIANIIFKTTITTVAFVVGILSLNILPEWKTFLPESIRKTVS